MQSPIIRLWRPAGTSVGGDAAFIGGDMSLSDFGGVMPAVGDILVVPGNQCWPMYAVTARWIGRPAAGAPVRVRLIVEPRSCSSSANATVADEIDEWSMFAAEAVDREQAA